MYNAQHWLQLPFALKFQRDRAHANGKARLGYDFTGVNSEVRRSKREREGERLTVVWLWFLFLD